MATLVLTAVGTALGGPVGGALGGLLGGAIDTQLFGTGPRRGPRLDDLSLQTSSYGTQIPRIYGTLRVAGTVVWATDLKEKENIEGGGKGSPESVQYSYSCSFAVALSSRPIERIGRIWADGKLIRGRGGDFKVKTRFRTVKGSEAQQPDPLIAEVEGASSTPAYRGLALAVFEDMALGEFGNRLPMLTFEVVADEGPVAVVDVATDASDGLVKPRQPGGEPEVTGYAVLGTDQRSAIEQLCEVASLSVDASGDGILAGDGSVTAVALSEETGWSVGGKAHARGGEWSQDAAAALPASLAVRYHEPARDFQAGSMRATMPGGRGDMAFDSAAALGGDVAKAWAEQALARRWAGRDRLLVRLGPDHLGLVPGDRLTFGWQAGKWRVEDVRIEGYAVVAECRRQASGGPAGPADPGRSNPQEDEPIGRSVLSLFDLPGLGDQREGGLCLHVAVSAAGDFRSVAVTTIVGGQAGPTVVCARRARLGVATTALPPGPATVIDSSSTVDVALVDEGQILLNADASALDAGANLCMIGDEMVQFASAEKLERGRYRLSHLLRGRRGSEWATGQHLAGDKFVMIDQAALAPVPFDSASLGLDVLAEAHGVADDELSPPSASGTLGGAAGRPLAPCKLRASRQGTTVKLEWVRRSAVNWGWTDQSADDSSPATFLVEMAGAGGVLSREVGSPFLEVDEEMLAGLGGGLVSWSVTALSSGRRSPPATAQFSN